MIILLKYVNLEFSNIEVVASQLVCRIYQTKNYLQIAPMWFDVFYKILGEDNTYRIINYDMTCISI